MFRILKITYFCFLFASGSWAQDVGVGFTNLSDNASQAIEISSETFRINNQRGEAVFIDSVEMTQGSIRLTADRLEVKYTPGSGLSEIIATDQVSLTMENETLSAERMEYTLSTRHIVLAGKVVFQNGVNTVSADRMKIDMERSTGVMEGNVRTVFQPSGTDSGQN